jgi:hypothetical protein
VKEHSILLIPEYIMPNVLLLNGCSCMLATMHSITVYTQQHVLQSESDASNSGNSSSNVYAVSAYLSPLKWCCFSLAPSIAGVGGHALLTIQLPSTIRGISFSLASLRASSLPSSTALASLQCDIISVVCVHVSI